MTVVSSARRTATTLVWLATIIQQVLTAPHIPQSNNFLKQDWTQYNNLEADGIGTYSFGYDVEDPEANNVQFRNEQRFANGTVTGSYGYLEPDGNIHMVHYIADEDGYRAKVENSARGGMLKPIPVLDEKSYFAYGYTPQMLAAIRSQQNYKKQKIHDQRLRPYDKQSEEQKLEYQHKNHLPTRSFLQNRNEPIKIDPYFNYGHLASRPHTDYKEDFLNFD